MVFIDFSKPNYNLYSTGIYNINQNVEYNQYIYVLKTITKETLQDKNHKIVSCFSLKSHALGSILITNKLPLTVSSFNFMPAISFQFNINGNYVIGTRLFQSWSGELMALNAYEIETANPNSTNIIANIINNNIITTLLNRE